MNNREAARQTADIREYYSQKCTDVYTEIQNNAPGWVKEENQEYDVTTWTFQGEKGEFKPPRGSNGQIVVKILGPKSYDYIRTEDFIARAQLVYDAAERLIEEECSPHLSSHLHVLLKERLQKCIEEIKNSCRLDVDSMRSEEKEAYFKEQCKKADATIVRFLSDTAVMLVEGSENVVEFKGMVKKIKGAEKLVIAERGRPTVIKIGKVGSQMMVSAQFTQGEHTIPSSMRTGSYDEIGIETKLSNHVLDLSGGIGPDGRVQFGSMMDAHSSYSPLQQEDPLLKQKIAYESAKEKIAATARNIQLANPGRSLGEDKSNPIPISLSTMMLLTPIKGDPREVSEHDQLSVTAKALDMLRYQEQPMIVKVNGVDTYVTVDTSYMNIPANSLGLGLKGRMTGTALERKINERGFYEFSQRIEEKLQGRWISADRPFPPAELTPQEQGRVDYLSNQLVELYKKYRAALDDGDRSEHNRLQGEIKKTNDQLSEIYTQFNQRMKEAFDPEKIKNYHQALDHLIQTDPSRRDEYLLQQRYLRSQELFYGMSGREKEYKTIEHSFQLQTLYILTNEQIGRHTEAFCKSAEDRTGWLRVSLLAHRAFQMERGRDPRFPEDEELYHKTFTLAAHELSASLENTKYNSEARGLQVGGKVTSPYVGANIGKMNANLAKNIFSSTADRIFARTVERKKGLAATGPSPAKVSLPKKEHLIIQLQALLEEPEVKAFPHIQDEITHLIQLSQSSKTPLVLARNYLDSYREMKAALTAEKVINERFESKRSSIAHSPTPGFFPATPSSVARLSTPAADAKSIAEQEPQAARLTLQKAGSILNVEFKQHHDRVEKCPVSDLILRELKDFDPAHILANAAHTQFPQVFPDLAEATSFFKRIIHSNVDNKVINKSFLMERLNRHYPHIKNLDLEAMANQLLKEYNNKTEQPFYLFSDSYRFPSDTLLRIAKYHVELARAQGITDIHIKSAQDPHYVDAVQLYCAKKEYKCVNESQWKTEELSPEKAQERVLAFANFYEQRYESLDQNAGRAVIVPNNDPHDPDDHSLASLTFTQPPTP